MAGVWCRVGLAVAGIEDEPDHALRDGFGAARVSGRVAIDIEHAVLRLQVRASRTSTHVRSRIRPAGRVAVGVVARRDHGRTRRVQPATSAAAARSMSSTCVVRPTDNRTAPLARAASMPMAASTPLTASCSEWQADPTDAATVSAASASKARPPLCLQMHHEPERTRRARARRSVEVAQQKACGHRASHDHENGPPSGSRSVCHFACLIFPSNNCPTARGR